jgi:antitoxin MazE
MVSKAQLAKWGNSLAVRIPKNLADEARLREGDYLLLEVEQQGAVSLKAVKRPKSLEELIAGITPKNLHNEQNWGAPTGAEVW